MNTEEIVKHLKLQDLKHISIVPNTIDLILNKNSYTREEIVSAYNKMLKYEGIEYREGGLITNTMFEFLEGTHHSLK